MLCADETPTIAAWQRTFAAALLTASCNISSNTGSAEQAVLLSQPLERSKQPYAGPKCDTAALLRPWCMEQNLKS